MIKKISSSEPIHKVLTSIEKEIKDRYSSMLKSMSKAIFVQISKEISTNVNES